MSNSVVHFEITGPDGDRLFDFYSKLFGWKIDASNPMKYGLVQAQDKGIGGGICASQPGAPPYATIYVGVDDVDKALADAEKLGGKTIVPKTTIPGMVTFAMFTDPAGNLIGLVWNQMP